MTDALTPDRLDEYVLAYLDGTLDPDAFDQLSTAMRSDPAALDRFVELACLDRCLLDTLTNDEQVDAMHRARHEQDDPALSFQATLELLSRGSESAELVHLHHDLRPRHRLMPYLVGGAVAAVFILAITLSFVFSGEPTAPRETASWPDTLHTPVATLTATHNAQWGRPASEGPEHPPTTGSKLHPNQRLTLTAGFAEITTHRGAIAILEAPATIELLDNNNAIHLHTGKLVGICETESSKGFVVRTPHMDITDLGTRFGVEANDVVTEVHVLKGEVQATRPDAAPAAEPMLLTANQSARASANTDLITRIDYDDQPFAALGPRTIDLVGTGVGLKVDQADPAWVVVSENGTPLKTPVPMQVSDAIGHIRNLPNDPQRSQWLAWTPERKPGQERPTYRIRTTILVPSDVDPTTAKLAIQYAADNQLVGVLVNGSRVEMPPEKPEHEWHALKPLAISHHLIAGTNRIEFEIVNLPIRGGRVSGEELGLRIAWQLHARPLLLADESPQD